MNSIEIFPALETCEQGCAPCPLAKKNGSIAATHIDPNVQSTFTFLEDIFNRKKEYYDIHLTSAFSLAPSFNYPKLLHMCRFETSKDICFEGKPAIFSNAIKTFLSKNRLTPKVIGFSYVPLHPVVTDCDMRILEELFDYISKWYFLSKNKKLEITIRSNLIKTALFEEILPIVFAADLHRLKAFIEKCATFENYEALTSYGSSYFYVNRHTGKVEKHTVELINRVIAMKKQRGDTVEHNIDEAFNLSALDIADFAIAPKGVMVQHASYAINNPVLWLSHEDFRTAITRARKKLNFSFLQFVRHLILQNASMYKLFSKTSVERNEKLTADDFIYLFEKHRPGLK